MPTIEQIENVWIIPECPEPEDPDCETKSEEKARKNSPEYKKYVFAIDLLTWWMDVFMPMAVGLEFWGPNIKPFHLMTDKVMVHGDVSGVEKVLVTITSEAYAFQTYANCRDKWMADYKYLKENKKKKIPAYSKKDPATHKHKNKWSNPCTGSVTGGGWEEEGLEYLNKMIEVVTKIRAEEEANGNPRYELAKKLIQIANETKMEDAEEAEPAGKKRKLGKNGAEKKPKAFEIIYIDE